MSTALPPLCKGRWYWEVKAVDIRGAWAAGLCVPGWEPRAEPGGKSPAQLLGADARSWGVDLKDDSPSERFVRHNGEETNFPTERRAYDGRRIRFALDCESWALWVGVASDDEAGDDPWHATPAFVKIVLPPGAPGVQLAIAGASNCVVELLVGTGNSPFQKAPPPGYAPLFEAFPKGLFSGGAKPAPFKEPAGPLARAALSLESEPALTLAGGVPFVFPTGFAPSGPVARSPAHAVAFTQSGVPISWGANDCGQCGWAGDAPPPTEGDAKLVAALTSVPPPPPPPPEPSPPSRAHGGAAPPPHPSSAAARPPHLSQDLPNRCKTCGGPFKCCVGSYGVRNSLTNIWRGGASDDPLDVPESPNTSFCCAVCEEAKEDGGAGIAAGSGGGGGGASGDGGVASGGGGGGSGGEGGSAPAAELPAPPPAHVCAPHGAPAGHSFPRR